MMKKWGLAILALGLFFNACKNDDDIDELPIEEQNQVDDDAIVEYLKDHYFDPERGLIKEFNDDDSTDNDYPTLHSLGTKLPSGVWIVKRPEAIAEGPAASDNTQDSILISYETKYFKASYTDLPENGKPYKPVNTLSSTINGSGTATWDPTFYYVNLENMGLNENINLTHFVIEGFTEGLQYFNSTDTSGADLYNFQGAIIVPSRAGFGRDFVYTGSGLSYAYRDLSFIFNFELHKVIPRNQN